MRKALVCVSLAALALVGCDQIGGNGSAPSQSVGVNPKQVSAADLQAAVSDPRVRQFYESRNWAPVWDDAHTKDLTAAFAEAGRHGMQGQAFLQDVKQGATPAEREAALTLNALQYAKALSGGIIEPKKVLDPYTVPANAADVVAGLRQAIEKGNVREWLASLAPQDEEYKALSDAYVRYAAAAKGPQRQPIQPGDKIAPGDTDARVPQVVAALRAGGYLPAQQAQPQQPQQRQGGNSAAAAQPEGTTYTKAMAAAVARVQADYGIKPDGIIGNSTLEALNSGAGERARILAVNLERRRWLSRQLPGTRIDVNTAATVLTYWKDGSAKDRRVVVAGQPEWETPEIGAPLVSLVANPDWTIPEKIAKEEILPKGAAYMAKEQITTKNGRLVQASGDKSALGIVKFNMADPYAIYLHDTPGKAAFGQPERHQSHGCVRVNDAIGFARMLADDEGVRDQFEKALATHKETDVSIPNKIPVRLLYHTAYLDGGKVVFRGDPYGWDDKLAQALGLGGPLRHRTIQHIHEMGP
jgi:murein L,D-transpeptidase YcbB/YkuD